MAQTEIPRDQWQAFCERFSRQHHGWMVTVAAVDTQEFHDDPLMAVARARPLDRDVPLRAIELEKHGDGVELSVITGEPDEPHRYSVGRPLRIRFEQIDHEADKGMSIQTEAGQTVLLLFRVAAAPETLNGISEAELR